MLALSPGSRRLASAALIALGAAFPAFAAPDGAAWDHDGGPGRPDCTACHFDGEAERESDALILEGLPQGARPGARYEFVLRLAHPDLAIAGFVMTAQAGAFESADDRTEAKNGAIRSTLKGAAPAAPGEAAWRFVWIAPDDAQGEIAFHIAANAGNDDASPFGDRIFLSSRIVGE